MASWYQSFKLFVLRITWLPWWLGGKEPTCQCRRCVFSKEDRSPGEGNDNPLQYSCLRNPRDRGARRAIFHGIPKELDMT